MGCAFNEESDVRYHICYRVDGERKLEWMGRAGYKERTDLGCVCGKTILLSSYLK